MYATTFSDSDSSTSDSKDNYDEEENFSAFMTVAHGEYLEDLNLLVEELGELSDEEFMGIVEESVVDEDEDTIGLRENYNSLLEKLREHVRVAKGGQGSCEKDEES